MDGLLTSPILFFWGDGVKLDEVIELLMGINPNEYDVDNISVDANEGIVYNIRIVIPPKYVELEKLDRWLDE